MQVIRYTTVLLVSVLLLSNCQEQAGNHFGAPEILSPTLGKKVATSPEDNATFREKMFQANRNIRNIQQGRLIYEKMTDEARHWVDLAKIRPPVSIHTLFKSPCTIYRPEVVIQRWATSNVDALAHTDYDVNNLDDFDLSTAWIEGAKKLGEGEAVNFLISSKSEDLEIDQVSIYNGYVKSPKRWNDHARVKQFELKLDTTVIAYLDLQDIMDEQIFDIPKIKYKKDDPPLKLILTIQSAYPSTKFEDTAVGGIYFGKQCK